jgi:glycosyltransferase involved in cell wall biosynthesis
MEVIRNGTAATTAVPDETIVRLRAELGTTGRVVVALARYQPEKGLDDLIEAVALLPAELDDVHVLLAGGSREDDSYERYLRRLAEDRAPGKVQFLGFRDDAAALLALAEVCVLPSRREGLPLVALEAQAAGCPLIAAAVGGIPEVVEHEATGLLFPPGDVEALSAALRRLLDDAALRERLRRAALERVAREGTLERQAEAFAGVLRPLV